MLSKFLIGFFLILVALVGAARGAEFPASLNLQQAVEIALSRHPSLQASAARVAATEGLKVQAALRPNPAVAVQLENWRAWGQPDFQPGQDADFFVYGSQTLEMGGKKLRRMQLADHDLEVAGLERRVLEWEIRQTVRRVFLRAWTAQKQLELLEENGRYFEQVIEYHRVRLEQGAIPEVDLIRVQLEGERIRLAEATARMEAEGQRMELLKSMGVAGVAADFTLGEVSSALPADAWRAEGWLARSREKRAVVLLGKALVARARSRIEMEKSLAKPDWSISFGYKRTMGFNTMLGGISVPLPLFNRNEGNILFSERDAGRAELSLQETLTRVDQEVSRALTEIRRRQEMLAQMEKGIVEQAEETLRISLAAYREGGSDLLRLLDAQRVRNEVQLLYARTRAEFMISIADLENAAGEEGLLLPKEMQRVTP